MITKLDNKLVVIPPNVEISVNWRLVESSNVDRVGWDRYRNMYVRFKKSGRTYIYVNVSRQRAVACAYAQSVGHYLNSRVKPKFGVIPL